MSRMMRIVAFVAAMSTSAAAVPATMERPSGDLPAPATGATDSMNVKPAEPPARPANVPGGAAALIIPGAILIGVAAALASGGGDEPAPFPSTGTSGTL